MKKHLENRDTIISFRFVPVYEENKRVEVSEGVFKHRNEILNIYFYEDNMDQYGNVIGQKRIWLDLKHLKEIIKEIEIIESEFTNLELQDDMPW